MDTTTANDEANYSISPDAGAFSAVHPPTGLAAPNNIYDNDNKYALITLTAKDMQDTNYTLTINDNDVPADDLGDIKDSAGYFMHPFYRSLSFPGDAVPRILRVTSIDSDKIMIQFSEDVNIDNVDLDDLTPNYVSDDIRVENIENPGFLDVLSNASTTNYYLDPTDNSKLTVTLGSNQTSGDRYKVILTGPDGIKDSNGNEIEDQSTGFFIGDGPLSILSVEANGPAQLIIGFSENLRADEEASTESIGYYDIPGLTVTGASWDSGDPSNVILTTLEQNQEIYTIILTTDVNGTTTPNLFHSEGWDGLGVQPDRDTLQLGNNTFSFVGDGYPQAVSAVAIHSNLVKLVFSEPVDSTTANIASNYTITSLLYPDLSVTGALRNSAPNSNEVMLTTSDQLYTTYEITASLVNDEAGNSIQTGTNDTADFAGMGTDDVQPDLMSVSASDSNVRVYFNEAVYVDQGNPTGDTNSANNKSNYTVSGLSTATLTVNLAPSVNDTLKIDVTDSATGTDTITITAASNEVLATPTFSVNGGTPDPTHLIAYSIASAINYDPDSPVRAYVNNEEVVIVSKTYGADGNIIITNGLNNVVDAVNNATPLTISSATRSSDNLVLVNLTMGATLPSGVYALSVKNVSDNVQRENAIVSTSKLFTVQAEEVTPLPPYLIGVFATDSTHIKLLFNEPVDRFSSSDKTNYFIERGFATFTMTSGGSDTNDTFTIVSDDAYNSGTYVMTSSNNEAKDTTLPATDDWKNGNDILSIANVLNDSGNSPVFAHVIGNTIYMVRKTTGGTITSIDRTGTLDGTSKIIPADGDDLAISSAVRSEPFPWEVLLTLTDPIQQSGIAADNRFYGITVVDIADASFPPLLPLNATIAIGGTGIVVPVASSDLQTNFFITPPSAPDDNPPEILSVESMSDSMVRVIFNESVDSTTANIAINYTITPSLSVSIAVVDSVNDNTVILTTDLQSAIIYSIVINNVEDKSGFAIAGGTMSFSGMAAVTVDNGPVGNTFNGIGNVNNQAITAMIEFDNRLYIATYNKSSGKNRTEIHASDSSGVYFTPVSSPGFLDETTLDQQQETSSFTIYQNQLWAATQKTPGNTSNILTTTGYPNLPHTWIWDTPGVPDPDSNNVFGGGQKPLRIFTYGIDPPHLYAIWNGEIYYRVSIGDYSSVGTPPTGSAERMTAFGGRLYVGIKGVSGMEVYRSKGDNMDFPLTIADFEQVLDAQSGGVIGMDGYDADDIADDSHNPDSNNTTITSMDVFNGYIFIGTFNNFGAQIWRSQDGLTWERVLDFGAGVVFGGLGDPNNKQITSFAVNGNFLYAGTQNGSGAEVWRTPDGVSWEQIGSNGFGSTDLSDVTAMLSFGGLIYIGMEDVNSGGVIFRSSN